MESEWLNDGIEGEDEITRLKKENKDLLDTIAACLVAAGAPDPEIDIDACEKVVCAAGTKPSHFIKDAFDKKGTFITYHKDNEIIITTQGNEKEAIQLYFSDGKRDLDDYEKTTISESGLDIQIGEGGLVSIGKRWKLPSWISWIFRSWA